MKVKKLSHSPLVLPVIFWIVGIFIGKFVDIPIITLSIAFSISFLLALVKKLRIFFLPAVILLLGFFRISILNEFPKDHIHSIIQNYPQFTQPVEGRIISEVISKDNIRRFTLELSKIAEKKVKGKIIFSTKQNNLQYGDLIKVVAAIRKLNKSSNPSSFDYEEFLAAKQIYATGYSKTLIEVSGSKKDLFSSIAINSRKALRKRINNRFGKYSGFVKAIVIGDKTDLEEQRTVLNRAGLSHLLAVSGLHVGILSLVIFLFLNIIIPNRIISRFLLIIILFVYGAVCMWSPSVTRAVLMISLYLISKVIQRRPDANNILAVSLLIITIFQPLQLFSVGLQMSYMAVFVLLNVLPSFRFIKFKKEEIDILRIGKKILNAVLILLISSFILNIFLSPITLLYFNQFNLNGMIGNLLGIPLISLLLPLTLVVIFIPNFGLFLYQPAFKGVMFFFDKWTEFSSNLPMHFDFIHINLFQFCIIYFILLFIFLWFRNFRKKISYLYIISIILLMVSLFAFGNERTEKLKITFFDCGLGDLALIETPEGETLLIDSGPTESTPRHFESSALPYFRNNGLKSLDWVVITHAHNDHYGGLAFILDNLIVKNLVVTDEFKTRKIWKTLIPKITEEQCNIITICDTTHLGLNSIKAKILHPDISFSHRNINNLSIVIRIDHKEFSVLFTGDMEIEGEEYLLEKYPEVLDCDVLKVGHHGSKTSSSYEFIKAVTPDQAFISTALKNRFHFPHKITLEKYEFLEDNLFISGKDGALQITTDGITAHFKTYLSEKEFIDNDLN